MKHKILIVDRFSSTGVSYLKAQPDVELHICSETAPSKELKLGAHALLIRTKFKVDSPQLDHFENLKVIVTATSGFDHIDLKATKARGLQVYFCPEGNQVSAAEHTLALALATARKILPAQKAIQSGVWERSSLLGMEISGKTWGLIGLGRIGSRVAKLAQAFGADVLACDPFKPDEHFKNLGVERVGVIEAFSQSDILSLHAPLTKETRHLVKASTLELMEPTSLLINTCRGEVIREQDLLEALNERRIAGAGLDVFENEPLSRTAALAKLPNVVLTPHVGANTVEAFDRSCLVAAQKALSFLRGESDLEGDPWTEEWFAAEQNSSKN
jgi:D-3-phosphoglycerate dehydrogenase